MRSTYTFVAFILSCAGVALAQAPAVMVDQCVNPSYAAVTFDESPSGSIDNVLSLLRSKGARATFHVMTSKLDNNTAGIEALKTANVFRNTIGLYTDPGVDLSTLSDSEIGQYLKVESDLIFNTLGVRFKFVRFPKGITITSRVLSVIRSLGFTPTTYNLDVMNDDPTVDPAKFVAENLAIRATTNRGSFIIRMVDRDDLGSGSIFNTATQVINELLRRPSYTLIPVNECVSDPFPYNTAGPNVPPAPPSSPKPTPSISSSAKPIASVKPNPTSNSTSRSSNSSSNPDNQTPDSTAIIMKPGYLIYASSAILGLLLSAGGFFIL